MSYKSHSIAAHSSRGCWWDTGMELLQGKHLKTVASKGRRGDALQGWRGAIVGEFPNSLLQSESRRGVVTCSQPQSSQETQRWPYDNDARPLREQH